MNSWFDHALSSLIIVAATYVVLTLYHSYNLLRDIKADLRKLREEKGK